MASTARPETLALQRMYQWEKTTPDKTVFTQPMGGGQVREWTWKQAMDEVRRMAAYLKGLNLEPGSRIAMLAKNTAHWMLADWAIWMAGHVSVPLYPTLAAGTVRQILEHSESKLLFVGKLDVWDDMKAGVPEGLPMVTLPLAPWVDSARGWEEIIGKTAPLAGSPVRPADELCTLIYTSGTTGMPKGVMHSFGTFAWSITSGLKRVPLDQRGRVLSFLPLAHVAERMVVEHGLLATGMHVFFAESLETFVSDIQRARPTVFFAVPRLWVKFQQGVQAKMPPEKMARLLKIPILRGMVKKKVLAGLGLDQAFWAAGGAAPMPPSVLAWYRSLGLDIVEVYGMTENCGLSHSTVLGKPRPGTVGTTYEGVQCRTDPATGEIQVKGECVMLGYYKQPEVTRETFTADGWLKTGQGHDRRRGQPEDHRPGQGPVQDRQGQIRGTGADRKQAGHPCRDRGLLRHRRQPRPAAGPSDAQPRRGREGARRRGAQGAGGLAGRAPEGGQRAARPARADGLPRGHGRSVVGGERHPDADHEGQAQQDRRPVRAQLRKLGRFAQEGGLDLKARSAADATGHAVQALWPGRLRGRAGATPAPS